MKIRLSEWLEKEVRIRMESNPYLSKSEALDAVVLESVRPIRLTDVETQPKQILHKSIQDETDLGLAIAEAAVGRGIKS